MERTFLAAAFGAIVVASIDVAAAGDLGIAVEAAWRRAALNSALTARQAQVEARERVVDSPFPRAPSVGFSYRRDLWTNPLGKRELEPELSLPLWAPGERDAMRALAGMERGALDPAAVALRLRVAAQVRESAWAVALAEAEVEAAVLRLESARALETDVERREKAGELPRADRLLARAEVLDAQAALVQAQAARAGAAHEWRTLTGMEPPSPDPEPAAAAAAASIDEHPEMRDRAGRVSVAMAQLAQAREVRRDGPELSVATRHDRDASGLPVRDTIRFGIRIPLDTEARNAPRIAAAGVALADVEVDYVRERQRLEADRLRAGESERAADTRRTLAAERRRVTEENHDLIERAFRLGERPLADLLRARALRNDARLEERRTRAQFGLARARLNQSLGVMP